MVTLTVTHDGKTFLWVENVSQATANHYITLLAELDLRVKVKVEAQE